MTAAQATDALTEAVCRESLQARAQKRKARIIVATAARLAPSPEWVKSIGEEHAASQLASMVKADIAKNGTIVIGIVGSILLFPIFMNILIGVICALIVRWIVSDKEKYGLIQQAKGN